MSLKFLAIGLAALLTQSVLAQETGPSGLAEPQYRGHAETIAGGAPAVTPENTLNLQLSDGGTVSVLLRPDKAPKSVERIKVLTARHFYDGLTFHRVIDGFMAQGGDPKGDGSGGSDLPDLKAEFNDLPHVRGAMAMARAQSPDSANSQFYLMLSPDLTLDDNYTVIGRVVQGMAYVDLIAKGEPPANPTKIVHAYFGAPHVAPAGPTPATSGMAAATQAAVAPLAPSDAVTVAPPGTNNPPNAARQAGTPRRRR